MKHVAIVDTTLRDGAQAPGITFSCQDRVDIAKLLDKTKVPEIEAGIPAMGNDEIGIIQKITRAFSGHTIAWCRALQSDIDLAMETGCDTVHISFPVSDIHLSILKKDTDWLFRNLIIIGNYARKRFARVSIGFQDASRAPIDRLIKLLMTVSEIGAFRVRYADTTGIMSPIKISNVFTTLLNCKTSIEFEFHGHNDLGMATANSITAVEAGVSAVSVTVNGIGERAGNAPLEEIAMGISCCIDNVSTGIYHPHLNELCTRVAQLSGREIPPFKPICGAEIFTHESGIHCHGQLSDSSAYEPYNPEVSGHSPSQLTVGSHSGTAGIRKILHNEGIELSREQTHVFITTLRKEIQKRKRSLHSSEVKELFNSSFKLN